MKGDKIQFYKDGNGYDYQLLGSLTPDGHYNDGYSLQLDIRVISPIIEPARSKLITLSPDGLLTIKPFYCWDGPSGPTIDTDNSIRASLIHDVLYQLIRSGKLPRVHKDYADRMLRDIAREDGMSDFRSWYWYKGVNMFAGSSCKPGSEKKERKIYTAP
jgi:hypothetical protein